MADFKVSTIFTARDRVSGAFNRMGKASDKFGRKAERNFKKSSKAATGFKTILSSIVAANLIGNAARSMLMFKDSIIETSKAAQSLKVSFKSIFGKTSGIEMKFVSDQAERLGLDLETAARGYIKIAASARGTILEGKEAKEIFLGVAEAATAMQLSSDETNGALRALSQIMSKGKVQAEELRGQLGERIPGAFQIAARAMKMTTKELDKMMSTGKLVSDVFIPAFAKQLRKEFGQAALDAAKSFAAAENRFKTVMFRFKTSLGGVLLPIVSRLFTGLTKIIKPLTEFMKKNKEIINLKIDRFFTSVEKSLKGIDFVAIISGLGTVISKLVLSVQLVIELTKVMRPLIAAIITYRAVLLGAAAAQGILTAAGWAYALFVKAQIFLTLASSIGFASAAMAVLNAVMLMNPVGLVIAGVVALGAAVAAIIIYWDEIIASLVKAWEIAKELVGFGDDTTIDFNTKKEEILKAPNEKAANAKAEGGFFEGLFTFENAPTGMSFNQGKGPTIQTSGLGTQ